MISLRILMKVSATIQVATTIGGWMLPIYTDEFRLTAGNGDWSKLRIYQPEAKDDMEKIGISRMNSKEQSTTLAVDMGVEIKNRFSTKMSLAHTWKNLSSATWSSEVIYQGSGRFC